MSSPLSGFTAVPNPYMVPLLYYQSLLIGAGFGIGYQGMRRKLSAMSNDDFNKLDLGTFAFDQFKEITAKSHFDKALDMMHPIMDKLAAAFGQMISKLPDNFMSFIRGATGAATHTHPVVGPTAGFLGGGFKTEDLKKFYAWWAGGVDTFLDNLFQGKRGKVDETTALNTYLDALYGPGSNSLKSQSIAEANKNTTVHKFSSPRPTTIYNPINLRRESQPIFDTEAQKLAKIADKKRILTNIGTLNSLIHNQQIKIDRSTSTIRIWLKYHRKSARITKEKSNLKKLLNIMLDLKKKLSNMNVQLKNFR